MSIKKPRLRALEVLPIQSRGEDCLLLRDTMLGLAEDAVVDRTLGPVLALLDGSRTVLEVETTLKSHGSEVPEGFVQDLVRQLDERLMLDSPAFRDKRAQALRDFDAAPTRPAAHAGTSYPAEPTALSASLDSYLRQAEELQPDPIFDPAQLRGIVVPHIDFHRGGVVEALGYRQLQSLHFDTIVVLGIAHSGLQYPFSALDKDYQTPLGDCRADTEFIKALEQRVGARLTKERYSHRSEHSVEFVAVFLQHLPELRDAAIVPILCGGFYEETRDGGSPADNPDLAAFFEALRETTREHEAAGRRVGFVVSVDLAHIGTRFGDEVKLTPPALRAIGKADRQFLEFAEEGDAEGLHAHIAMDNNLRHVDAHPALYTVLASFPELRAQLLHYAQAYDESENNVVSFASMALYEP